MKSKAELKRIAFNHPEINQVEQRCTKKIVASKERLATIPQWYHTCWLWSGSVHNGSPCFKQKKKRIFLRPFLFKFLHPEHDSKHERIHMSCGIGMCVNPFHMTTNKETAREHEQLLVKSLGE